MELINIKHLTYLLICLTSLVVILATLLIIKNKNICSYNDNGKCALRDVYEKSPFILAIFNSEGILLNVNRENELFDKFGFFDREEDYFDHLLISQKININEAFKKEIAIESASGYIYMLLENIRIDSDNVYYLLIINDITEQKLCENELKNSRNKAVKVIESQNSFLAIISHELRTPLSAMIGLMELVIENIKDQDLRIVQSNAIISAQRLEYLVNNILDYSKINAKQLRLNYQWENLPVLLAPDIRLFELKAKSKGLDFVFDWKSMLNLSILVDGLRLNQIITNLLSNAIKFTDKGYVYVKVNVSENFISIIVKDSGIGINKDHLSKIFEPFIQADNSITRNYGGSGLGLSIVHNLVQLMSGTIDINSQENIGTLLKIRIPVEIKYNTSNFCVRSDTVTARNLNESPCFFLKHDKHSGDNPCDGIKNFSLVDTLKNTTKRINQSTNFYDKFEMLNCSILVVEDDLINRFLIDKQLKEMGANVHISDNAHAALKILENRGDKIDLIITDYHMPNMNGMEMAKIVRTTHEKDEMLPIILLTADYASEIEVLAACYGITQVLYKPYTLSELYVTIQNCLTE